MASNWRELYSAAVLESNQQKLPERIWEAERELIRRARELFLVPSHDFEEEQAIDQTLRELSIWRDSLNLKHRSAA